MAIGWFQINDGDQASRDWSHLALNYIGTYAGQAIRVHLDGVLTGSDDTVSKSVHVYSQGEGRVVVGREFTHLDHKYASVTVDELLFFNETLSDQQILDLKDMF